MMIVSKVLADLFLGAAGYMDYRHKKIPVLLPAAGIFTGCAALAFGSGRSIWDVPVGMIPGSVMILTAFLTNEKIGYGDGLMLLALGLLLPAEQCMMSCCFALLIEAAVGLVLLAFKKVTGKSTIPFLPFLLLGYVMMLGVYE